MGLGVADVPPVAHDALMPNVRTTLTIDEHLLRAVKIRAARSGLADSEVIQDVLRRDFGLDLLECLGSSDPMPEGGCGVGGERTPPQANRVGYARCRRALQRSSMRARRQTASAMTHVATNSATTA